MIFPQKWQFRLENENFEISRNLDDLYKGHVKSLLTDPYIYLEVVMQKSPFHSKTPTSFNLKQMFDQINC